MKIIRVLFIMIGCAVLLLGMAHADPSSQTFDHSSSGSTGKTTSGSPSQDNKNQTNGKPDDGKQSGNSTPNKSGQTAPTDVTKSAPQQTPNGQKSPVKTEADGSQMKSAPTQPVANGPVTPQPNSSPSVNAPKGGTPENTTSHNQTGPNPSLPVRPPSSIPPTGPSLKDVPHLGPNPPIIGGSIKIHTTNTATINGTGMSHKR